MGLLIEYTEGQTPLSAEDSEGLLIKSITTNSELNEFEQLNIEKAIEWTMHTKIKKSDVLTEEFVKTLHKKMFSDVWKWAGKFRKSDTNIGCSWTNIGIQLRSLLDDTIFWIKEKSLTDEEIAIRFKHRLVSIHCFPNGNGRHSRIMADIIMEYVFNKPIFSWSESDLTKSNEVRKRYIDALKKADGGDINQLIKFATS